jgi:hypothetical protein
MISRYASLRQGLVGAWCPSLGASGFRLIDRSGYNNHGTLTNMAPTSWVASNKGAINFTAGNIPLNFLPFLGPLTVSIWIRKTGNPAALEVPFSCSQASGFFNQMFFIGVETDGRIRFQGRSSNTDNNAYSTSSLQANTWTHVCGFGEFGKSVSIAINGRVEATSTSATVNSITGVSGVIGSYDQGRVYNPYLGMFDDTRIYKRALTPAEINLLYTGGRGVGLAPERIKHRRKTTAAATNRRRRIICGANC